MDSEPLPFRAEYAKSGRASCRSCKSQIGKDTLRIAAMVQSPVFDGKMAMWYHMSCFFNKQRPTSVGDIEHYESLRFEDQEKIKEKIASASSAVLPGKKGKKRAADKTDGAGSSTVDGLKDFHIEYAKSGRATCKGCEIKIGKDEIRISKKDFESDVGRRYGGQDRWHHVECFVQVRAELLFFDSVAKMPGFVSLSVEDQKKVKAQIPAVKQSDIPVEIKKPKLESDDKGDDKKNIIDEQIKEQSKIIFKFRDELKRLKKTELQELLEYNDQDIPVGVDPMCDRLGDIMAFGQLQRCPKCKEGQLVFDKAGYICQGQLTEWVKCQNVVADPKRKPFKIPKELKEEYSFLKKYKYVARTRAIHFVPSTAAVKKEEEEANHEPKVKRERPPLYEMNFVLGIADTKEEKKETIAKIKKMGGSVRTNYQKTITAFIFLKGPEKTPEKFQDVLQAKPLNIHVVSKDFLDEAPEYAGRIAELVIKKSICSWGGDPNLRIPSVDPKDMKSRQKSRFTSAGQKSQIMKIKGGGAIDPASGLEAVAHVYEQGEDKYNAVLSLTDLQKGKNSFYKIQLLQADKTSKYWVFRAWGRISTTVGGNKLEPFSTLMEAKTQFKALYEEKTGNQWEDRHNFVKIPDRFYPVDVDYGNSDENSLKIEESSEPSKLANPVQNLVKLIFDINTMKKVMLEFELDTEKMPLGKLSKKQIQSAFAVLSELQNLVNNNGSNHEFIGASNRFYTFIPHSFGMDNPPLINKSEMIKDKLEMLDSLMEMEVAYSLMKSTHEVGGNATVDGHYAQLKTDIEVIDKDTEEFKLIEQYVTNSHAATHSHYSLNIEEVFKVQRKGELRRYKPFKKLHNRKLLWHGSRTTNFAGILSQGLRIAPPEAPVTGYMFGKGIYFADMVSKSANYCCTNSYDPTGLMLLCEVALGDQYDRLNADYIEKLPKGKHSCKGVGMTHPDPTESVTKDGVEIPVGKGVPTNAQSSLLYNEYIVYDIAQVNVQYLLKMNFKYMY